MALSKTHNEILKRAHEDPKFRVQLLKELVRIAVAADPKLLDKAIAKIDRK